MTLRTEAAVACRACEAGMGETRATPRVTVTIEGGSKYPFCGECSPFVLDLLDDWRTGYAGASRCGRCRKGDTLTVVEARIAREHDGVPSVGVRAYRLCPECLPEVEAL